MLHIYHVPGARSVRAIWLCEELGQPYEVEEVDFSAEYRRSPEWRRLNPIGKVPAMTDGDISMFESGAMVQYILAVYGNGRLEPPRGTQAHAWCLQWCWFSEASLARPLGDIAQHTIMKPAAERVPEVVEDGRIRTRICLDALEDRLSDQAYLAGDDFTVADIMMGWPLMLAERLRILDELYPEVMQYFARIADRPGYRTAMET